MQSRYKNVLFISEPGDDARSFFRATVPANGLFKRDWTTRVTNVFYEQENHKWNGWSPETGDSVYPPPRFIVLHSMLAPNKEGKLEWHSNKEIIQSVREHGQYVFFDLDDNPWAIPVDSPAIGPIRTNLHDWIKDVNSSNGLLVSTPAIAKAAAKTITVPIYITPNAINYEAYDTHDDHNPLRIGWFGDISFRGGDLQPFVGQLRTALQDQRGKVEFWHFGADFGDYTIRELLGKEFPVDIVERPWYRANYLQEAISQVDIGIITATNNDFNNGRSNIMGLAFAAAGVPFIASPIAEYIELDENLPCIAPDEFFGEYLYELIQDAGVRKNWRDIGPKAVMEWYSPKIMAQYYEEAFEQCLSK